MREPEGAHPPLDFPGYKSTALRHPKQPLIYLPQRITEVTGPQLSDGVRPGDNDLTPSRSRLGPRGLRNWRAAGSATKWARDLL